MSAPFAMPLIDPPPVASATGSSTTAEPVLAWRVNPWRERRHSTWLATGCWLAGGLLLAGLREPMITFVALFAGWTLSLGPALFTTDCRVDERGFGMRTLLGWRRLAWRDVRRVRVAEWGVFASPFAEPSWRERFRAFRLEVPAGDERRAALLDALRHRLAAHGL